MASAAAPARGRPAAPPVPAHDVAHLPVENPALLVIGVMAATLLQVLDTTIANVAIPHMQSTLSATPDTISWVLTSYIIASAVAMPITGWLADRIGSRRLFILSVAGFVVASMLCGMAQSLTQMVIFRALQGVGGAFIAPLSQAALLDTTRPSKQGQIIALWGMGVMIGPILGPVLGGWITENWSWRWCFYVNVPVGAVCLAIMMAELPSRPIVKRRFDLFGFALIAIALSCLQLLLDRGNPKDWFQSFEICVYGFLILSSVWIAVIHFVSAKETLFDRSLFANVNFVIALLFMVVIGMVMFATMALLPPMLQGLFNYDVVDTGMALMPRGVGVLISMQVSA
jgi:DHA2 family multidrug resistance protein